MPTKLSLSLRQIQHLVAGMALVVVAGPQLLVAQALHDSDAYLLRTRSDTYSGDEQASPSPLSVLIADEITQSGERDILVLLQKRDPNFIGAGNLGPTNASSEAGATLGGSMLQIRGLPTLVLYEGRRLADAAAIAVGGAEFTDVSLFPLTLLSRIEVLKGGVSALYGSGAIGGVVNIATRDEFEGAELGFRYGTTVESGVAERRGYAMAGVRTETTQVTAGIEYEEIDALFEREREYSAVRTRLTSTYGGTVRDPVGYYLPIGFDPLDYPGSPVANSPFDLGAVPGAIPGDPGPPARFGTPPLDAFYRRTGLFGDRFDYNLAKVPTSTLARQHTSAIASATHQVFGKQLELFGNFLYSTADTQSVANAEPLSTSDGVIIPAGRVGLTDVNDPAYNPGVNNTIFNPFNYQIDTTTAIFRNRTVVNNRYQVAPLLLDNTNNFYRFLGGVRSELTEDWTIESAAYYSKYDTSSTNQNRVRLDQLNAMIAGTAVDADGNQIPALDFFALNPIGTHPGQVSAAQLATAFGASLRQLSSFQRVFDGKITGTPLSLPGGKVRFSLGGEYRLEGIKVVESPEIFAGSTPLEGIDRKRDIQSLSAELDVPIVAPAMSVPFVRRMELNVAGRFDSYEDIDEDALSALVALRYEPVAGVTFRASWGSSFDAPNLYELHGPQATNEFSRLLSFPPPTQALELTGSNPRLGLSRADTYSAGVVIASPILPGLLVTADFFKSLRTGIPSALGPYFIVESVDELGPASPYSNLVAFGNFPGRPGATPVTGPFQLGFQPDLFYIDNRLQNAATVRAEGWDLAARYNVRFDRAGELDFGASAIVFTNYDTKTAPLNTPHYNLVGLNDTELFGVVPDYKLTFFAEYRISGFALALNGSYIPETLNAAGVRLEATDQDLLDPLDCFLAMDGRLSYDFRRTTTGGAGAAVDSKDAKGGAASRGAEMTITRLQKLLEGVTVTIGCNNIFNEQPPRFVGQFPPANTQNANSNLAVYDPYGRFVYFEIAKKF